MAATAEDVYTETVRTLPLSERLRLAALILDELTHRPDAAHVEYSDAWTEQDQSDLTAFSLHHAVFVHSKRSC